MPWGTPRSYGRNIDVGLECLEARLVPTVGMTWGTPRSYGGMTWGTPRSDGRSIDVGLARLGARLAPMVGTLTWGLNALGHASFLR